MKTLEDYNKDRHAGISKREFKAGVKCDKCETEMIVENPYVVLASWPAQQWVTCPKCNHRGLMVV